LYNYGVLRVDSGEGVRQHNEKLLGPNTLGVEITRPDLAAQCGLGNIDPQHDISSPHSDSSAILESLTLLLPPKGATLVTIRPDADSFGAMAVLTARFENKAKLLNLKLIETIHLVDCVGPVTAQKVNPWIQEYASKSRIISQISKGGLQVAETKEQVLAIRDVLTGKMSSEQIARLLADRKFNNPEEFQLTTIVPDKVMLIETRGQYGFARQWGSARFPVTIICDYEYTMPGVATYLPHKRWSIVRASSAAINIEELKRRINESESAVRGMMMSALKDKCLTWGGPQGLVSSPQGRESALSNEDVIAVVRGLI